MITRQQVTKIIATAWQSQTDTDHAWAERFATALDALGLIQFCDIAEDDNTSGQPDTALGQKHEHQDERRNRTDPVS